MLPNHGSMFMASGIFLVFMNISLSYGRERKVSKPTYKLIWLFYHHVNNLGNSLSKVHYLQSPEIPYCSTKYNWILSRLLHVRGEGWCTALPMFSTKPGSALDLLKHWSLNPQFWTDVDIWTFNRVSTNSDTEIFMLPCSYYQFPENGDHVSLFHRATAKKFPQWVCDACHQRKGLKKSWNGNSLHHRHIKCPNAFYLN